MTTHKIDMQKGMAPNNCSYPITEKQYNTLKPCGMVNPKVGKSYGLKIPDDFNQQEAAEEILRVRLEVQRGIYPRWFMEKYWPYNFPIPTHWPHAFKLEGLSEDDPEGLANVVHMDDPLDFPLALKKSLSNPRYLDPRYSKPANIRTWHNRYKQFIETVPEVNNRITSYQLEWINKVFEVKSWFGLGRPEEVLAELGALLTAYEEGCPPHGAIGQGHEGFSQAAVLGIHDSFKLDVRQIQDILYASYLWGQFRCLAGVHYGIDAIMSIVLVGGPFEKYFNRKVTDKFRQ